jgi:hypothetical protein
VKRQAFEQPKKSLEPDDVLSWRIRCSARPRHCRFLGSKRLRLRKLLHTFLRPGSPLNAAVELRPLRATQPIAEVTSLFVHVECKAARDVPHLLRGHLALLTDEGT